MHKAVEELGEYREEASKPDNLDRTTEEFGDILFNAAELSNVLSDMGEKKYYEHSNMDITHTAISATNKYWIRDNYVDLGKLIKEANKVCTALEFYRVYPLAPEAMEYCKNKMKERWG